jgi:hypothetical protein
MRAGFLFSRVIVWTLVAAISMPPAPASAAGPSERWARVTSLKPNTRITVTLHDGDVVEGWLVLASPSNLTVGLIRQHVTIARDRVREVAIVGDRRPWYAPFVVAAAVAGGLAVTAVALWGCDRDAAGSACSPGSDDSTWFYLLLAMPVFAGVWAYRKMDERSTPSLKVIYKAPPPADLPGR